MSLCPKCHASERFCVCAEEKFDAELERTSKELEIYRLRLAGALMASEGANPLTFKKPDILPEIRDCPTINSVLDLYTEMQKYRMECEHLLQENNMLHMEVEQLRKVSQEKP